jgi:hypothetical protein
MPPVGKITVKKVGSDTVYSDEAGQSWTLPGPLDPPLLLTKPIYEQVIKLQARDRAAAARAKRRERQAAIA